jgi:hypothetical protein
VVAGRWTVATGLPVVAGLWVVVCPWPVAVLWLVADPPAVAAPLEMAALWAAVAGRPAVVALPLVVILWAEAGLPAAVLRLVGPLRPVAGAGGEMRQVLRAPPGGQTGRRSLSVLAARRGVILVPYAAGRRRLVPCRSGLVALRSGGAVQALARNPATISDRNTLSR